MPGSISGGSHGSTTGAAPAPPHCLFDPINFAACSDAEQQPILRDQVPQFVDRYLAGEIDVDSFVSHKLSLDDVNRGFELMEAQDGIRSVLELA